MYRDATESAWWVRATTTRRNVLLHVMALYRATV